MSKTSKAQAYKKVYASEFCPADVWEYEPVDLLPECKSVTRLGVTYEYQKVRNKFLGLIPYTEWVAKERIVWYPEDTVEYYTCSCVEELDMK